MNNSISPSDERALGERLRREAAENRPVFSQALHRRILATVERPSPSRRWLRLLERLDTIAGAIVAACLLIAVAFGWRVAWSARNAVSPAAESADVADAAPVVPGALASAEPAVEPEAVATDSDDSQLVNSSLSLLATGSGIAGLSTIDCLRNDAMNDLHGLLVAATTMPRRSAELKDDTRLAAEALLRRLPVGVELVSEFQ